MSWSLSLVCWDHELDGKFKALIEKQPARQDNPASNRALLRVQEHVFAQLVHAPFGCRFHVESHGHYDSTGNGDHTVHVTIVTKERAELTDRMNAEAAAAAIPASPPATPVLTVPSATGVGVDAPPAPTVDNTTHPIIDPNLEDVPPTGGA